MNTVPGRSCPLHYRHAPEAMAQAPADTTEVLYVAGGLYGNTAALATLLALFAREHGPKRLVFNGDFHWFDTDPAAFAAVEQAVSAHTATRGNVETELADRHAGAAEDGADTGCGCAYPDWVDPAVVERSNRIITRLRATARRHSGACERLASLPMWLRIDIGPARVAIVHGDAESLAGWGFAPEHLADPVQRAKARQGFDRAQVDVFASSHTCSPILQTWGGPETAHLAVINNGAAGMPNLAGVHEGLVTRIGPHPPQDPVVAAARRHGRVLHLAAGAVCVDAVALAYDDARWQADFLAQWPPGSDAHASYWPRIHGWGGSTADAVCRHTPGVWPPRGSDRAAGAGR